MELMLKTEDLIEPEHAAYMYDLLIVWGKRGSIVPDDAYGICQMITGSKDYNSNWCFGSDVVKHYARDWEYYSGDELYPVPSPREDVTPSNAFGRYNLWGNTLYGNRRRNLCRYIAMCLKRDFNL